MCFFVFFDELYLFRGLLQLCVQRWRQGHGAGLVWLLVQLEIEAHPLSLFCCICNWRWILSLCVWLFFHWPREEGGESCEPAELFLITREEKEHFFLGALFLLVIDEWNGMAKGAAAAASFPPFFSSFTDSSIFFFFLFTPPPPSRATWKVTGLYTHTQTESTVTGLISDRPAETLSEWLNGKRLSPLLLSLLTNQQKRTSFFSYSIFLLLAGWYQSLFFLISSDFIYFYFLIIRNFVRQFLKMAVALRVDCKSWSTFVPVVGQF